MDVAGFVIAMVAREWCKMRHVQFIQHQFIYIIFFYTEDDLCLYMRKHPWTWCIRPSDVSFNDYHLCARHNSHNIFFYFLFLFIFFSLSYIYTNKFYIFIITDKICITYYARNSIKLTGKLFFYLFFFHYCYLQIYLNIIQLLIFILWHHERLFIYVYATPTFIPKRWKKKYTTKWNMSMPKISFVKIIYKK